MDTVDSLVAEAESKVAVLPDQRHLWLLLGETLVRLHCLELEVAELREGARR
jgi:cytochrome c-type biogenesis protein CcmH/NrfG